MGGALGVDARNGRPPAHPRLSWHKTQRQPNDSRPFFTGARVPSPARGLGGSMPPKASRFALDPDPWRIGVGGLAGQPSPASSRRRLMRVGALAVRGWQEYSFGNRCRPFKSRRMSCKLFLRIELGKKNGGSQATTGRSSQERGCPHPLKAWAARCRPSLVGLPWTPTLGGLAWPAWPCSRRRHRAGGGWCGWGHPRSGDGGDEVGD